MAARSWRRSVRPTSSSRRDTIAKGSCSRLWRLRPSLRSSTASHQLRARLLAEETPLNSGERWFCRQKLSPIYFHAPQLEGEKNEPGLHRAPARNELTN